MTLALENVTGVQKATVDFKAALADVKAKGEPCTEKGPELLIEALKKAGYGGSVAKKSVQ